MKNIYYLILIILFTSSCSISSIRFDAIKPAKINVPTELESVIIAYRTTPTKNNRAEYIGVNNVLIIFLLFFKYIPSKYIMKKLEYTDNIIPK